MSLTATTPQTWGTGIFMLYLGLSVVGCSNVVSLYLLNNKSQGVNTAGKTATVNMGTSSGKTNTSSGGTIDVEDTVGDGKDPSEVEQEDTEEDPAEEPSEEEKGSSDEDSD